MFTKRKVMKSSMVVLVAGMLGSVATPVVNAAVDDNSSSVQSNSSYSQLVSRSEENEATETSSNTVVVNSHNAIINGKTISKAEFDKALKSAWFEDTNGMENSDARFGVSLFVAPVAAAPLFIPGIGEAYITAAGTVVVAGVAVAAGTWLSKKVIAYFKAHRTNRSSSNHDKHTKPRSGRSTTKNRSKKGYKSRNNKRSR